MNNIIQIGLLVLGFYVLVKGADWFVEGTSSIASKFGIPQIIIGLTIVAFGTSAPEAGVSISAALKGNADLTVGNILGSNVMNVLFILAITAIITPLVVQKCTFRYEIPFVLGVTVLLYFLGADGEIARYEGLILWAFMAAFMIYLVVMSKSGQIQMEEGETDNKSSMVKLILLTFVGGALIIIGSNLAVDSATELAKAFGISDRIIGLTVIAFGTSLPELVTSVIAATKGKADIAIGNIVGSNIFNILFVIGASAIITPIAFAPDFLIDCIICMVITVALWAFILISKKLKRYAGVIMLVGYAAYFIYII